MRWRRCWRRTIRRLFFSKSFPGSAPAYVEIAVDRNGNAKYKEAADDDQPLKFQLAESDTNEIFDLADKLGHFNHPLEAPVKVAFMGMKTFRFESGSEKHEVKFNYSRRPRRAGAAGLVRAHLGNRTASDQSGARRQVRQARRESGAAVGADFVRAQAPGGAAATAAHARSRCQERNVHAHGP